MPVRPLIDQSEHDECLHVFESVVIRNGCGLSVPWLVHDEFQQNLNYPQAQNAELISLENQQTSQKLAHKIYIHVHVDFVWICMHVNFVYRFFLISVKTRRQAY
jgi:hypothetical protein